MVASQCRHVNGLAHLQGHEQGPLAVSDSTSKSPTRLHFKVTYKVERQASARDHGLQEHGQGKEAAKEHFKNFKDTWKTYEHFLNFEEHFNAATIVIGSVQANG